MLVKIQAYLDINDKYIWWKDKFEFNVQSGYKVLMSLLEANIGINLEPQLLNNLTKA